MDMKQQQQLVFFADEAPSEDVRRWMVSSENPGCPFSQYIGNEAAVRRLAMTAFSALGNPTHVCSQQNFAFLGPASTGKTTLAKHFATLVGLPFIEISPGSVDSLEELLQRISGVLSATTLNEISLELVPVGNRIKLPPMVVFIDEVHALSKPIIQGLLKATEKSDGVMDTGKWQVNCRNVCWIIATTDRGLLFDAFDTRFTKINLELYTMEQITRMVKLLYPEWSDEVCKLVALYGGRLPREVKGFASEMKLAQQFTGADWISVAHQVAKDQGIDEFGMSAIRLLVLKALSKGAVAAQRLPATVGVKIEELNKFILPPLLSRTADQNPLIAITPKGFVLTEDGMAELDKRKIRHGGKMNAAA